MYTNPLPDPINHPLTVWDVLKEYLYWPYLLVMGFVVILVILIVVEIQRRTQAYKEQELYKKEDPHDIKEYRMPSHGWPKPGEK